MFVVDRDVAVFDFANNGHILFGQLEDLFGPTLNLEHHDVGVALDAFHQLGAVRLHHQDGG